MSQSMKALNAMLNEGISMTEAADRFGISKAAVSKAKLNPSKKHVMTQTIEQLQAKVAELEEEKRLLEDDCGYQMQWKREFREQLEYSQKQLAAEQLNNKLLREHLRKLIEFELLEAGALSTDELCAEFRQAVIAYNATPISTEALDAYVAEKVKEEMCDARELNVANTISINRLTRQRDLAVKVLKTAYEVATNHDDRLPFDWAVYCEMLWQAIKESEV